MKQFETLLDQYQLTEDQEKTYQTSIKFFMTQWKFQHLPMTEQMRELRKTLVFNLLHVRTEMLGNHLTQMLRENQSNWTLLEGNQYVEKILTELQELTLSELFDEYVGTEGNSQIKIEDLQQITALCRPGPLEYKS